jgi:GntR family transcriptional regulator
MPPDFSPRDRSAQNTGDSNQPRYLHIASQLKQAIASGRYPVGAKLPTEAELCAQFDISRFTAREAVRVLSVAGLVSRRQRVGTLVIALPDDARYTYDASSVRDLLQYAQDTELRFVYIGRLALSREQAKLLGAQPGLEWVYAIGLRIVPGETRPLCVTRLFLNPLLKGIESKLRGRKGAVYELIENEYKISIERVDQELQAVLLDTDDAGNLGTQAGAPALKVLRRYYDRRGRLLELAENVHPSERFSYRMQLHK